MFLIPHPLAPHGATRSIEVHAWQDAERWHVRYLVEGIDQIILPNPADAGRAEDLWRTTCFELFVADKAPAYREFNFSPSHQWAAYSFQGHREGMREAPAAVEVWLDFGEDWIAVEVAVEAHLVADARVGLSAVIAQKDGSKSYWALAHPPGAPDFHHEDCFAATLPSIGAP